MEYTRRCVSGELPYYFQELFTLNNMSDDKRYTHLVAIDFGTAGCGISLKIDRDTSEGTHIFSQWLPSRSSIKSPTIILLDENLECKAFGLAARKSYIAAMKGKTPGGAEPEKLYLFEYFKMNLYKNQVAALYDTRLTRTHTHTNLLNVRYISIIPMISNYLLES